MEPGVGRCSPVTVLLTVYPLRPGEHPRKQQALVSQPNPGVAMGFQAWSLHLRQGRDAACSTL